MGRAKEMMYDGEETEQAVWDATPEGRAWRRQLEQQRRHEQRDDGFEGFPVDFGVMPAGVDTSVERHRELIERLDRIEAAQAVSVVKEAYTTHEVAERLNRSEWTIRQWCNQGQVKGAYKVRGKGRTGEWRLSHDAVLQLQREGPAPVGTFKKS